MSWAQPRSGRQPASMPHEASCRPRASNKPSAETVGRERTSRDPSSDTYRSRLNHQICVRNPPQQHFSSFERAQSHGRKRHCDDTGPSPCSTSGAAETFWQSFVKQRRCDAASPAPRMRSRRRPSARRIVTPEPRQMNAPCARTRLCKKQSHSQWGLHYPLSILPIHDHYVTVT